MLSEKVQISLTTYIESTQDRILVYPAPAENTLIVEGVAKGSVVIPRDVLGEILQTAIISNGSFPIDISRLAHGVYMIESPAKKSVKFIKQ